MFGSLEQEKKAKELMARDEEARQLFEEMTYQHAEAMRLAGVDTDMSDECFGLFEEARDQLFAKMAHEDS